MRKYVYFISGILLLLLTCMASCSDEETYADQKKKEVKAINSFLGRDVNIVGPEGDTLCKVGKIKVIDEKTFEAQDSTTNLAENEYVLLKSSGVYMQIVRKGVGKPIQSGDNKRVLCRFFEFNILGDSLQLNNSVLYWHTNPEIMDVSNTLGSITASFNTTVNGGGAMYAAYSSTSVPTGWILPLSYVGLGRQTKADEGIAKVRLIVPHSQGQTQATSNVYPCFYEVTYQEMRD